MTSLLLTSWTLRATMDFAKEIVLILIAAVTVATGAAMLRRRYGPWALLAGTGICVVLIIIVLSRLFALVALFFSPAVPGLLATTGVLEWRARRQVRDALWRDVAWGSAAFVLGLLAGAVVLQVGLRDMRLP